MTDDLDTSTADLDDAIRRLWQEAQGGDQLAPPEGFGQSVTSVPDSAIAEATGLDLAAVREFLEHADGTSYVVGRDGEARSVQALR